MKPYYDERGITIYHGDCREAPIACEGADHIITDPPYSPRTHAGARTSRLDHDGAPLLRQAFDSITFEDLDLIFGMIRPLRWLVSFLDWKYTAKFADKPPTGLDFVRFGIWNKPNGMPQLTGDRPAMGWESIGIMHNSDRKKRWNGGGNRGLWTYNKVNGEHPTTKPLPLVRKLVELFTDKQDVILDPFMGSGTTLRAAKDLGRRAVGCELNERYCEIAANRLRQGALDLGGV